MILEDRYDEDGTEIRHGRNGISWAFELPPCIPEATARELRKNGNSSWPYSVDELKCAIRRFPNIPVYNHYIARWVKGGDPRESFPNPPEYYERLLEIRQEEAKVIHQIGSTCYNTLKNLGDCMREAGMHEELGEMVEKIDPTYELPPEYKPKPEWEKNARAHLGIPCETQPEIIVGIPPSADTNVHVMNGAGDRKLPFPLIPEVHDLLLEKWKTNPGWPYTFDEIMEAVEIFKHLPKWNPEKQEFEGVVIEGGGSAG